MNVDTRRPENRGGRNEMMIGWSRRRALLWSGGLILAALLLRIGAMFSAFLKPVRPANGFGGMVDLGGLENLPAAGADPKHVPAGRFWLIHDTQGVSALRSSCTHLECLFSWDAEKQIFVCPCHGSEFDREGSVLRGPAARPLDRYPIILTGEDGSPVRSGDAAPGEPLPVADLLASAGGSGLPDGDPAVAARVFLRVDTSRKIDGRTGPLL